MNVYKHMRIALNLFIVFSLLVAAAACNDDPPLPDNVASFEATTLGMEDTETELDVTIRISRSRSQNAEVVIGLVTDGITYGTEFTTEPAVVADKISVIIPSGSTEASFTISKVEGLVLDGDEQIVFTIEDAPDDLIIDTENTATVTFAEILSEGATMEVNGGGENYPNKVFIDLSANRQEAVNRKNWHLGFYSGDVYRVAINSSTAMFARPLDKNDLSTVTAEDTLGFANEMILSFSATPNTSTAWIDAPSGALDGTAIAAVSETASENKVYIVKPEEGDWKKIRVLRTATGYTVQYADIASTTFQETSIEKDASNNFEYFHFTEGAVSVEPINDRWDIAWTYFINTTPLGPGALIPYGFQDMVLTNIHGGAEVVQVMEADKTYEGFTAADVAGLTFNGSDQLTIGANWRNGGGPSGPPSLRTDRFYVLKDAAGNYYKLKFTALYKDGVRGTPAFKYALL